MKTRKGSCPLKEQEKPSTETAFFIAIDSLSSLSTATVKTLPKTSREDFDLIFAELDDSNDFTINLDEFSDLCNAIGLRFQKEDSPSWFETFPTFYHAPLSEKLKDFVRSGKFEYIVIFILIMNLVAVIIETTPFDHCANQFDCVGDTNGGCKGIWPCSNLIPALAPLL
ncbi:unnamed protein product [Ilex paraguariensis]|uniref:EF-hand domain-containing protein n=1 Tax=Ilex paraguariensis TaxID=185542 RepID=A0ABC8RWY3_9AQUA